MLSFTQNDDDSISSPMYHMSPNSLDKFTDDKATHMGDNDYSQR
jgi:hypothetical protein